MNATDPNETTDLCELIGDLSEGLFLASYNEDQVREHWNKATLNEMFEDLSTWERERCDRQMEYWNIQDRDYQSFLTQKVREAGGWSTRYSHLRSDLSPLTPHEKQLCGIE